jgi:NAD(P)-dependent dehydrogenase (short-subunit alcohol dehydrogenase family)
MSRDGLAGRRVLVTGASGAFGSALSEQLTRGGARVVGLDLEPSDGEAPVLACDVTDERSVQAAVADAIDRLGGLDVLVNNAGIGGPADSGKPPDEHVRRMFEVNTFGAWHVTAAAIDALCESRGRVVFVASRMAFLGLPLGAAYGVSKRALVAYADALRAEYGTHIQVTCVHPAFVRTPIHDASAQAGLSVEALSREEPIEAVVGTIVDACAARRPPRETATTRAGSVQLWVARHLPGLADRVVARTLGKRVRAGVLDGAPLAAGLRERHGRTG